MLEAALASVYHSRIGLIAGLDGLIVVSGATGLNDCCNPFAQSDIHPVSKWKKRITDHGRTDKPAFFSD